MRRTSHTHQLHPLIRLHPVGGSRGGRFHLWLVLLLLLRPRCKPHCGRSLPSLLSSEEGFRAKVGTTWWRRGCLALSPRHYPIHSLLLGGRGSGHGMWYIASLQFLFLFFALYGTGGLWREDVCLVSVYFLRVALHWLRSNRKLSYFLLLDEVKVKWRQLKGKGAGSFRDFSSKQFRWSVRLAQVESKLSLETRVHVKLSGRSTSIPRLGRDQR